MAWLVVALESSYDVVVPRAEEVLARVGRMKYLRPLYAALLRRPGTRALAERLFERQRQSYHPIAQQVIEGLLAAR